jgi:hypothetical protein
MSLSEAPSFSAGDIKAVEGRMVIGGDTEIHDELLLHTNEEPTSLKVRAISFDEESKVSWWRASTDR